MSFLPIVERELRVASRKKFTYWGRLAAAGFALVIFGLLLGVAMAARGAIPAGQIEFTVLKWMTFVFACCAGIFFTSDSISEEKREGTLGLLFLTDLRGYDVVFGKLLSQSLRAFYGVLAAFPILALPLLLGGVTGGEFALSMLVIANTLFFSLAIGLFVSTVSRDYTKAMSGTFLVCLLFFLGLAFVDSVVAELRERTVQPFFNLANPAWLFSVTRAYLPAGYWQAFGIQHGLAWAFLLAASLLAPRIWQEKSGNSGGSVSSFSRRWRFGGARVRAELRRRWLETGPVHWLAMRDRWLPRVVGVLAGLVITFQGCHLVAGFLEYYEDSGGSPFNVLGQLASTSQRVFGIGLTLWVAAKASQIFIDSVRNGALELLLVTPVTPRAIVQAQWTALWRTFLVPALCIVLLQTGSGVLSVLEMSRSMTRVPVPSVTVTGGAMGTNGSVTANTNSGGFKTTNLIMKTTVGASGTTVTLSSASVAMRLDYTTYQIVTVVLGAVTLLTGLASVAWFGMWMGLTNRKISVVVLKTVCFVYVLPWIAFGFIYGFTMVLISFSVGFFGGGRSMFTALLLSSVVGTVFNLAKDAFFIVWSRRRLLERFRATVAQEGKPRRPAFPPPPMPGPPVMGAPAA